MHMHLYKTRYIYHTTYIQENVGNLQTSCACALINYLLQLRLIIPRVIFLGHLVEIVFICHPLLLKLK